MGEPRSSIRTSIRSIARRIASSRAPRVRAPNSRSSAFSLLRARRQVPHATSRDADEAANIGRPVGSDIVEHGDVAGLQLANEDALQEGLEDLGTPGRRSRASVSRFRRFHRRTVGLADLEQRSRFLVRHPGAVERRHDALTNIDRLRPPHRHLAFKPEGSRSKDDRSRQSGSAVTRGAAAPRAGTCRAPAPPRGS